MALKQILQVVCILLVVFIFAHADTKRCKEDTDCGDSQQFCYQNTCHTYTKNYCDPYPCEENEECSNGHNNMTEFAICQCKPGYTRISDPKPNEIWGMCSKVADPAANGN